MELISRKFRGLGTTITLSVANPTEINFTAAMQLVSDYEDQLTVNRPVSEVMTVNQAAGIKPVKVSKTTYQLVQRAVAVSRLNLGFNVAIGPLVKLWKIGFTGARKPTDAEINTKLGLIDPNNIELNATDQTVFLTQAGMELDLGGIAKGFIADEIKALWLKQGVQSGIIDLGGNILLVGPSLHADQQWAVGIQNPNQPRQVPIGVLHTTAKAVGTSGIYERKLRVAGKEYHHMFDSHTGYPIQNNLASVTIISDRSIDGEIWSTIAFYQGLTAGKALIEQQPGIEAVFVTKQLDAIVTSGLADIFQRV